MLGLICAGVVTAWVVYMIIKQYKPEPVLICAGLSLMFCAVIFKISPILSPKETTGLIWLDPIEVIKNPTSAPEPRASE